MNDYSQQARVALRVYKQRSLKILDDLAVGRTKHLDQLLRLKTAAFHNFRAADALSLKSGVNISEEEDVQVLWREITEIDQKLATALEQIREEYQEELAKSHRVRVNIGKYRSGLQVRSAFEREI